MNKILILLIGVLIISCNQNRKGNSKIGENATKLTDVSENFGWLLGKWKRINEEAGKKTFENWVKKSDAEYIGLGFTMQNGDTIKQEKMKLVKLNNNWHLEVKVPEESESIIFKMSSYDSDKFTCENRELDFPKQIKYWRTGNKINALVSGDDMEIAFEFEKLEEQ